MCFVLNIHCHAYIHAVQILLVEEKSSKKRKFNGPEYLTATFSLI